MGKIDFSYLEGKRPSFDIGLPGFPNNPIKGKPDHYMETAIATAKVLEEQGLTALAQTYRAYHELTNGRPVGDISDSQLGLLRALAEQDTLFGRTVQTNLDFRRRLEALNTMGLGHDIPVMDPRLGRLEYHSKPNKPQDKLSPFIRPKNPEKENFDYMNQKLRRPYGPK